MMIMKIVRDNFCAGICKDIGDSSEMVNGKCKWRAKRKGSS